MAAIALCLDDSGLAGKMKHLWYVQTDPPGDHAFVMLSDGIDLSRKRLTLQWLANPENESGQDF